MYFVIITGVPDKPDSHISLVEMGTARAAHNVAMSEYRRRRDIPSNIQLQSHTAFKSDNMAEATMFFAQLQEKIREAGVLLNE